MRKCLSFCVVITMLLFVSITVYAQTQSGSSLGHAKDVFEYGRTVNWKGEYGQYSKFYCNKKNHSATAVVGESCKGVVIYHYSKSSANSGHKASAETKKYGNVVEWNSYYKHS